MFNDDEAQTFYTTHPHIIRWFRMRNELQLTAFQRNTWYSLSIAEEFSEPSVLVEVDVYKAGIVTITICINLQPENSQDIIEIGLFSPVNLLEPDKVARSKRPMNVINLTVESGCLLDVYKDNEYTYVKIKPSAKGMRTIRMTFRSLNTFIKLGEREPFERYVLGIGIKFLRGIAHKAILIEKYPADLRSRFVKGNHIFEAASIAWRQFRIKTLYYDLRGWDGNIVFCHGMGHDDPSKNMQIIYPFGAVFIIYAGGILYIKMPFVEVYISLLLLAGVLIARSLLPYLRVQFHISYKRGGNIPFVMSIYGVLWISFAIVLLTLDSLGYIAKEKTFFIFIGASIIHLIATIVLIVSVIFGVFQKYTCDFPFCSNKLRLRAIKYEYCPATDHVICHDCWKEKCLSCICRECERPGKACLYCPHLKNRPCAYIGG